MSFIDRMIGDISFIIHHDLLKNPAIMMIIMTGFRFLLDQILSLSQYHQPIGNLVVGQAVGLSISQSKLDRIGNR